MFSGVLYFVILLIKKFCLNMKMNNSNAYFYIHLFGFALKKNHTWYTDLVDRFCCCCHVESEGWMVT